MIGIGEALMCAGITGGETWRAGVGWGDVLKVGIILAFKGGGLDDGEPEDEEAEMGIGVGVVGRREESIGLHGVNHCCRVGGGERYHKVSL